MFVTPLPYDYVKLLDRGDRVRRRESKDGGGRIRRESDRVPR